MVEWLERTHAIHLFLGLILLGGGLHHMLRTGFRFPRYVHVLAGFGLALGFGLASLGIADARTQGTPVQPVRLLLVPFVLPVLVYFFFVFYGGHRVALTKIPLKACRFCGHTEVPLGACCPKCGQASA